ncbi:MAG: GNAT family N-acetyltransferase [Thermoplasmatota archaeon]
MDPERKLKVRTGNDPGDLEKLTELHKAIYTAEYDLDGTYVEEMSEQFREFFQRSDPRERLWIVEKDGKVLGSMAALRWSDDTAVLRWLLIHPDLRGRGLGKRLMKEAIGFSREVGYRKAFLWTLDILKAAASIYRSLGFELAEEEYRNKWGHVFKHQRYELWFGS